LGWEVHQVALSAAETSVPENLPRDVLRGEILAASAILGILPGHLSVERFVVRKFPEQRQEILEHLVRLNREIRPTTVLLPSTFDTHQDHQVACEEGFRAFKNSTMLGYEVPWNNPTFATQAFVPVSESELSAKIAALRCYKSQHHRPYASEDYIRALALTRGMLIGEPYAEAFQVLRWIVR
jgi:LmbE family N-acetylglucosaminyl deacetylase